MKEKVTEFDLTAAFAELNSIDVPAVRGIVPNRPELREGFKARKLKTDILMEDYYDVNDQQDVDQAQADRQEDVAQAKLSRIEKIVDLDAETAADVEGSYVGRNVVRCPQCMTLFYRKPEDLVASDTDPKTVNVGEECPNCGNTSGYELLGKIDEVQPEELGNFNVPAEGEQAPAEEAPAEEQPAEEPAAEEPAAEPAAEEAAPANDESADLDLDLDLGGEEKKEESLHRSEANAPVEKKHCSDHDSENLTLNEGAEMNELLDANINLSGNTVGVGGVGGIMGLGEDIEDTDEDTGEDFDLEPAANNDTIVIDLSDGGNVDFIRIDPKDEALAHEVDDEATRQFFEAQKKLDGLNTAAEIHKAGLDWEYAASGADFFEKVAEEKGLNYIYANDSEAVSHLADESLCEDVNNDLELMARDEWIGGANGSQINGFNSEAIDKELDANKDIAFIGISKTTKPEDKEVCVHFLDKDKKELSKKCYKQDETNVLHEAVDDNKELNKKLEEHNAYIKYLQDQIKAREEELKGAKNDFIKASIQRELDALNADLETAIPDEVKNAAPIDVNVPDQIEEIPAEPAAEEPAADATAANDAAADEPKPEEEPKQESLNKSKVNAPVEKKHLSDYDSENLTLNESDGHKFRFYMKHSDGTTDTYDQNLSSSYEAFGQAHDMFDNDDGDLLGLWVVGVSNNGVETPIECVGKVNPDFRAFTAELDAAKNGPGIENFYNALDFGDVPYGRRPQDPGEVDGTFDDEDEEPAEKPAAPVADTAEDGDDTDETGMAFQEKEIIDDGCYYLKHNNIAYAANENIANAIIAAWNANAKFAAYGTPYVEKDAHGMYWIMLKEKEPDMEKGLEDPYAAGLNDKYHGEVLANTNRKAPAPEAEDTDESIHNPEADKEHRSENISVNKSLNEDEAPANDESADILADKIDDKEPIKEAASDLDKVLKSKEFKTPVKDADIKFESLDEIDDKSVEECITESLTNVYENVKSFNMTNCTLDKNNTLVVEGKINFKSGKSKSTKYCFTEAKTVKGKLVLNGINEGLDKDGKFTMTCSAKNRTLITEGLEYNYKVDNDSVSGKVSK